jgi:hypothetical protein
VSSWIPEQQRIEIFDILDGAQAFLETLPLSRLWLSILWIFTMPPDRGADTSVFAAVSPVVRANAGKYKGQYLVPFGKIAMPNANGQNAQFAKDLWETSEQQLASLQLL